MTEQFIDDQTTTSQETDKDLVEEETIDTKSPEYQLKVLQQRLEDKDTFINTLKEEGQTYREMVAQMDERLKNMETIGEVLKKGGQQQVVSNQDTNLDEDALVGKVIENLSKREAEERMQENWDTVVSRVQEVFGKDNINEKVKQAAQENGLSVSDLKETAKRSPKAFYKLVGLEGNQQQTRSIQPTHSTMQSTADTTGEKDFAYYSRLMRENFREYMKPEVQREFRKLFNKQ